MLKGFIFGISIAAPIGPIGVLCINRTLADSRTKGFVSGIGAATADGFYGFVAAFGLTFITKPAGKPADLVEPVRRPVPVFSGGNDIL